MYRVSLYVTNLTKSDLYGDVFLIDFLPVFMKVFDTSFIRRQFGQNFALERRFLVFVFKFKTHSDVYYLRSYKPF